ncbi:nucleolar protein 16-like [Rhopalosiphum maidis]|uniref:nucleolar protein 16-like n=1 Tax=Rhopalosiphum maidis TaxID=43146 RepID=UPI000EFE1222|nr:nucleolar protein 16-like [Rhopalosiphum maidis]
MPVNYNKKKLGKKMKKTPSVACPLIKDHWNDKVSVAKNLSNFGLTNNPSKSILTGFTNTQQQVQGEEMKEHNKKRQREAKQPQVVKLLEEQANKPTGIKQISLPTGTIKFITYLMEKYGDNYKEMTKDPKNVYQMTWKQIRAKILTFKSIKAYEHLMPRPIADL